LRRWISNSSLGKAAYTKNPKQSLGTMDGYKDKRKGQRKRIMHLGIWNIQGLKNKYKIIIKDLKELKLYIILTEKDSRLETISGFVHFYSGVSKEKKEVSIILKKTQ